jgi:catalase
MTTSQYKLGREYPTANEENIVAEMIGELQEQLKRLYPTEKTLRQIHPKMNGCVKAEFKVEDSLPEGFSVGVFKQGACYPAWIRFSNGNTVPKPDQKKDVRGVAIKLMNVKGEKLVALPNCEGTQDFLLWSSQTFFAKNLQQFRKTLKAATSPKKINLVLYFLNPLHFKITVNTLKSFIKCKHPFSIPYYSTTPYQFGNEDTAVKYLVKPSDTNELEFTDTKNDNFLRANMVATLAKHDIYFDFCIQFQKDADKMPVEDPSVLWTSPFIKVATIRIPKQVFDTPAQNEFGENLTFNTWHSLPEHRPIGCFNRARRRVYQELYRFRAERNMFQISDPHADENFLHANNLTGVQNASESSKL